MTTSVFSGPQTGQPGADSTAVHVGTVTEGTVTLSGDLTAHGNATVGGTLSAASAAITGTATAHGRQLLEVDAIATEAITPNQSLVIYVAGVAYKVAIVAV